jgi:hypothetical protein
VVTVVLRHSESLNLKVVECSGAVTTAQLGALAACAAGHPALLEADGLNIVHPNADLSGVDLQALAAHFAHYQSLYAPLRFQIYRRTAWVCQSLSAEAHVDFWVLGDASRKAFSTNARRLETLAEACDWLLLNGAERAQVERREGFIELAVFDDAPDAALAR